MLVWINVWEVGRVGIVERVCKEVKLIWFVLFKLVCGEFFILGGIIILREKMEVKVSKLSYEVDVWEKDEMVNNVEVY